MALVKAKTCDRQHAATGFTLIEVLIVVVILAIVAALVIPSISQGRDKADEAALKENLRNLRRAIQLYTVDHGGQFPTLPNIEGQLTQFTNPAGQVSATKTATHTLGPYLPEVPKLNVGARKGNTRIHSADANDVGWIYTPATGAIRANTFPGDVDSQGTPFNQY